ncbi:MAG: hypothetical protein LKI53_03380, partial [Bacteroidales bacterium]|nr:hypothetical protein [Bacteroidales bacterium]
MINFKVCLKKLMSMPGIFILAALCLGTTSVYAWFPQPQQLINVHGTITDSNGKPVSEVTIQIEGRNKGTSSDNK